jgi:large-conductance mechanosensitive channel
MEIIVYLLMFVVICVIVFMAIDMIRLRREYNKMKKENDLKQQEYDLALMIKENSIRMINERFIEKEFPKYENKKEDENQE